LFFKQDLLLLSCYQVLHLYLRWCGLAFLYVTSSVVAFLRWFFYCCAVCNWVCLWFTSWRLILVCLLYGGFVHSRFLVVILLCRGWFLPSWWVFLYSSSIRRSVFAPSGRVFPTCCTSLSGMSSIMAFLQGPCSQFCHLSVVWYWHRHPLVSSSSIGVAGVATPFTITWLFKKSSRTPFCLIYGVPIIMSVIKVCYVQVYYFIGTGGFHPSFGAVVYGGSTTNHS